MTRSELGQPEGSSAVIVAVARTPIGRLLGSLKDMPATALGGVAIRGALNRARVPPRAVDYVVMGHVLQAGAGQNPARQAAALGGVPMDVPAVTVNKVCLSGIEAIAHAGLLIRAGECDVVVAGGMESMSRAPHLLTGSRAGHRVGDIRARDHLVFDGLHDAFTDQSMGLLTESANGHPVNGRGFEMDAGQVSREEQDAYAAHSQQAAARAWRAGLFADEVVPAGGVTSDEGVRPETTTGTLARLRPAFQAGGTITAGNASPISDGACALLVMSARRARELGLPWLAEIVVRGSVAGPDSSLQLQPAAAIRAACSRAAISPSDLDLIEINEAFAAVVVASTRALGIDPARVNVNGGAIALGHPIGMSGARITAHLVLELARRGGGVGAAALCGGGGQGDALVLRVPAPAGSPGAR